MSYDRDRDIARFAERHGKHLRHEPLSQKPWYSLNLLKFTKKQFFSSVWQDEREKSKYSFS